MAKLARGVDPFGSSLIVKEERKKADARVAAANAKSAVPLPDEEELQRTARRKAAVRFGSGGSGRASTVLSNDGTLGA